MNQREPSQSPAGTRRATHCLSLLLLTTMAPISVHAFPRPLHFVAVVSRSVAPMSYLPATGAPPLRFQEPAAIALASSVGGAESTAATSPANASPTPSSASATGPDIVSPGLTTAAANNDQRGPNQSPTSDPSQQPARTPAPILPDDARPAVRPEDFLPYFQIPGSAQHPSDVTLLVPAPKAAPAPVRLPASSATYRQTP
jgi:hypothetical protein